MDIAPRNIIIDNRGVIGLLDWGCAGFYPASFETWSIVLEARLRDHPIAADLSSLSLDTATLVERREIFALDKVFSANQRVAFHNPGRQEETDSIMQAVFKQGFHCS